MKQPFWAKIFFMDFVGHYIGMTDKEIVKDVRESIVALTKNDGSSDSFGSMMVKSSKERIMAKAAKASRENGSMGGRPLKLPNWNQFLDFIGREGIDYSDAREWWEMSIVDRKGKDRDGEPIRNWIVMLKNFCAAKAEKRSV